jgi:hypothetical protein
MEFCQLLRMCSKRLPETFLVTDGEAGIVNSFKTVFPEWKIVGCWNHILTGIEMWLKKHRGFKDDIVIYKSNVTELLHCDNGKELQTKLSTLKKTWSGAFVTYFEQHLSHRINETYSGHLKALGLAVSSITTNMSESLNTVIKRFQSWKEQTPDLCIFTLYRLQLYYAAQVDRSCKGFGPYTPVGTYSVKGIDFKKHYYSNGFFHVKICIERN